MGITRRELLLGAAVLPFSTSLFAKEKFPTQPLKIIVPFAPGGSNDMIARLMAPHFYEKFGRSVVVENRGGAGGSIGAAAAARSTPDGHTLLFHSSTLIIQPNLVPNTGYDPRDFEPVTMLTESPLIVEVSPHVPAKTFAEFLEFARDKKNDVFFGSPGHGSTAHLAMELFNKLAGTNLIHVPFKGNAPATNALLAGEIHVTFDIIPIAKPLAEDGRVRLLATTAPTRSSQLPDVPTVKESGVPGFAFTFWQGASLPKGTPAEIVEIWAEAIKVALEKPEIREALEKQGAEIVALPPQAFRERMYKESDFWAEQIKEMDIKV